MNDIDYEKFASDMVNIFGVDTIMKYFLYRAKADMNISKKSNAKTYLILDQISGFCKIGKTTDVKTRLQSLSCGNPNIKLLFVIDADVEEELHLQFKLKKVKGEWFSLSPKDIESIKKKWCEKYTPSLLRQ